MCKERDITMVRTEKDRECTCGKWNTSSGMGSNGAEVTALTSLVG